MVEIRRSLPTAPICKLAFLASPQEWGLPGAGEASQNFIKADSLGRLSKRPGKITCN